MFRYRKLIDNELSERISCFIKEKKISKLMQCANAGESCQKPQMASLCFNDESYRNWNREQRKFIAQWPRKNI
ncbi:CLUMA_CG006648, isoform A [Clunio marinus]|uniref:CLUMA_CG006648, isoform A n=1 Tax=Clunio marinus TaxID=568069 RepID=A0A1J1I047_9DIPT|nr:CLUMA_CG006648, isoform A [Clunio marinus]